MNVLTPKRGGRVAVFTYFLSLFLLSCLSADAQITVNTIGEPEIKTYTNLQANPSKKQRKKAKEAPIGPVSSEELNINVDEAGRTLNIDIARKKWKESLKLRVLRADKSQVLMGMFSATKSSLQFPIGMLSEGHYFLEITDHSSVFLQKIELTSDAEAR